ncbi:MULTISPECIES: flagellar filament capping protein FliD [unclassified Pseudomonas]|uniref:flagellar filament capping protein FliD n=1 Tax=unclassified Pseudomonas TaxID=196821 RepID=UPI002AC9541D|nr:MULTISPECIES: flagellar filament capping protein FliD [unclassified Pseudomonas]MEB0041420.1 flagellar filament capping protein FliD [Pseudomonas sp. MH10]MEB0078696.1 flagellar filament capping protein FliD [Pseudomonas sp. MH10out]MEB0093246.1 flagellar filament capping protein FliD [Pseudomonas sp. CCI4.2]MEB0103786.1 flagellar filament capping protein FliD [Pseudomonas sp. CCI3.2]MEB0121165.1 flagellar filament capping protein FliD [Pseudomonas sp. CCI1.2]
MASPITTSTGLGSGLDIGSIVNALVASDTIADTTQIKSQTADVTAKLSGVSQLNSAMATFQTALTALSSPTAPAFTGFSASSSTPATLTTTSDNTAVSGNYVIAVQQLATGSKVASASFSGGATSAIPTGTLNISQNGTSYKVTIPDGSTLQSTRDAINTALKGNGITANIVTDANGSRLVLGSTNTGAGSDLSVSGIAGLEINGTTAMDGTSGSAGYVGAVAQNAKFTVDGLAVSSASNTVTPISGISMTLLAGAGATSTVTVATNTSGLQTSLQTFINAYNALTKTLNTLTAPGAIAANGTVGDGGAMANDPLPRSLISSLRSVLVTPGPGSQLSVLSQLGIQTSQADGTLSLDTVKFASAMNDKNLGGQVQALFSGTPNADGTAGANGMLVRMGKILTPYTQSGGILATRTSTLTAQQSDLTDRQTALNTRTADLTTQLTAKYNAMDLIVGQLKATATSITSFFASLNGSKTG